MSHWIHNWLYITVLCLLLNTALSFYDISPDCSPTKACLPNQVCWYGYCHCEDGYVRYNHTCFKIRSHGEDCFYVEQCPDHRMQCKREPGSSLEVKYCLCDKYHPWNETMKECVPAVNIKIMLSELWEKMNRESVIRSEADVIFWTLGIAAFTVLILGGTLAVFCVVYGCYLTDCLNNENSSTTQSDQRVGKNLGMP